MIIWSKENIKRLFYSSHCQTILVLNGYWLKFRLGELALPMIPDDIHDWALIPTSMTNVLSLMFLYTSLKVPFFFVLIISSAQGDILKRCFFFTLTLQIKWRAICFYSPHLYSFDNIHIVHLQVLIRSLLICDYISLKSRNVLLHEYSVIGGNWLQRSRLIKAVWQRDTLHGMLNMWIHAHFFLFLFFFFAKPQKLFSYQ